MAVDAGENPRAVDTLELARRRFPGAQHSLDALCRRFGGGGDTSLLLELGRLLKPGRTVILQSVSLPILVHGNGR